ncbi:helix-turn-helix domain-containing protein [Streptomyces sp. NPDC004752]
MHVDGSVEMMWATVPLGALADQSASRSAAGALLAGEVLCGTAREAAHDRLLMSRWAEDLGDGPAPGRHEVCLLEMLARLARLAVGPGTAVGPAAAHSGAAERMLAVIARSYTDSLTVPKIAERAGTHPTYAAQAFKDSFGMPIWHYVTQLRVAHASNLLAGTDWGVDRIAHASGFQTRSSFYRAFHSHAGTTPTAYRRSL